MSSAKIRSRSATSAAGSSGCHCRPSIHVAVRCWVPSTIPFHAWILANADFQTTGIDIGYVERTFTADGAHEAMALLQTDTMHREGEGADPYVEKVEVLGKKGERVFVEVVHERGGTFVAIPLEGESKRREQSLWCRSNTRAAALSGVERLVRG